MKGEIGSNGRHRVRAGERSAPFVVALIGQRELTGFSLGKIDLILDEAAEKKAEVSPPRSMSGEQPARPLLARKEDAFGQPSALPVRHPRRIGGLRS